MATDKENTHRGPCLACGHGMVHHVEGATETSCYKCGTKWCWIFDAVNVVLTQKEHDHGQDEQ